VTRGTGQWALMLLTLIGLLTSIGALFYEGRGGGIHEEEFRPALEAIPDIYLPLLGVMAGFLFAQRRTTRDEPASAMTFVFAVVITGLWVLSPAALLLFTSWPVESIFALFEGLQARFANTLVVAAVAFFFAKGS